MLAAICVCLWGIYRILQPQHTPPTAVRLGRIAYVLFLGTCVFPLSGYVATYGWEPCHGQGSGFYAMSHKLQCEGLIAQATPWWMVILYLIDTLVLLVAVSRVSGGVRRRLLTGAAPLFYFFVIRFVAVWLLSLVKNPLPQI